MKEKEYTITLTESQMRLMADAIEDWSRFLSGQCEMWHAISLLENYKETKENLETFVRPYVVPELKDRGASWSWNGGGCPNEHQRKAIAMSYMLYREIIHYLTVHQEKDMSWNCYNSPTLTCPEQGPLIRIKKT